MPEGTNVHVPDAFNGELANVRGAVLSQELGVWMFPRADVCHPVLHEILGLAKSCTHQACRGQR